MDTGARNTMPSAYGGAADWPPRPDLVWTERVRDADSDGRPRTGPGMVRHPEQPYRETLAWPDRWWRTDVRRLERSCREVAARYLGALLAVLRQGARPGDHPGIADEVAAHLQATASRGAADPAVARHGFGWLDVRWGDPAGRGREADQIDQNGSFWLVRHDGRTAAVAERSLVLLAGRQWRRSGLGGDIGLRLTLHLRPLDDGGTAELRIGGATWSGLCDPEATLQPLPATWQQGEGYNGMLAAVQARLREALRLSALTITALRPTAALGSRLRVRCIGLSIDRPAGPAERFEVEIDAADEPRGLYRVRGIARLPAGGGAAAPAWGGWLVLNERPQALFRGHSVDPVAILGPPLRLAAGEPVRQALANAWFEVRRGAVPDSVVTDMPPVVVDPTQPVEPFSDVGAALTAYQHANAMFDRLLGAGLRPEALFRHVRLPLYLHVHAPISGAPEGEVPAAEVQPLYGEELTGSPEPVPAGGSVTPPRAPRMRLSMMFGAALPQLRNRIGRPAEGDAPDWQRRLPGAAQGLSVVSDPRWFLHEAAHVLQFAATGELQLPFVHSVGDGLAAIDGDPESVLAGHNEDPARGITYPWVQIEGRRHDRDARTGYGWCGRRNLARLAYDAPRAQHLHGYFGEQIMSSSLFRLYRTLGGDTRLDDGADNATLWQQRRTAAGYSLYLVVRALALLGSDAVVPARSADQFVSALIDADLGTGRWRAPAGGPGRWQPVDDGAAPANGGPVMLERRGGLAVKLIRWAFERQGLYATDDPSACAEDVGRPPPVDVYIADRRARLPGCDDPGGYAPVPLVADDPAALFLAAADAVTRDGERLLVRVGNRGALPAAGLRIRAWWADAVGEAWRLLGEAAAPQPLAGRPPRQPGAAADPSTTLAVALPAGLPEPLWVLVVARADGDEAHLWADAGEGFEPPIDRDTLLAWISGDNNVALARLDA